MPARTPLDTLLLSLKKKGAAPNPVYLLHGDEEVLKDEAIRALLDAAVGTNRDFNLDVRYAADLTPESFDALVNTPPMLAERRAVVVRGVEQLGKRKTKLREEVARYVTKPNPTTVLVLVVAAGEEVDAELARGSSAVLIEPLAADRVPGWLHHHASTLGVTLAPDAADLLLKAVGNDLSTLAQELGKLASLAAGAGRAVTPDDVTSLVGVRRGETVVDLVDAAMERLSSWSRCSSRRGCRESRFSRCWERTWSEQRSPGPSATAEPRAWTMWSSAKCKRCAPTGSAIGAKKRRAGPSGVCSGVRAILVAPCAPRSPRTMR